MSSPTLHISTFSLKELCWLLMLRLFTSIFFGVVGSSVSICLRACTDATVQGCWGVATASTNVDQDSTLRLTCVEIAKGQQTLFSPKESIFYFVSWLLLLEMPCSWLLTRNDDYSFCCTKAGALLVINIFLELTVCLRLTGSFRIHFLSQNYFQYAEFCWCILKSFSLWIDRFSFPVPMYIYRISHDPWSLCIYNFGKVPMLSLTIKSEKVWLNFW